MRISFKRVSVEDQLNNYFLMSEDNVNPPELEKIAANAGDLPQGTPRGYELPVRQPARGIHLAQIRFVVGDLLADLPTNTNEFDVEYDVPEEARGVVDKKMFELITSLAAVKLNCDLSAELKPKCDHTYLITGKPPAVSRKYSVSATVEENTNFNISVGIGANIIFNFTEPRAKYQHWARFNPDADYLFKDDNAKVIYTHKKGLFLVVKGEAREHKFGAMIPVEEEHSVQLIKDINSILNYHFYCTYSE